jgi:signal peptidase I
MNGHATMTSDSSTKKSAARRGARGNRAARGILRFVVLAAAVVFITRAWLVQGVIVPVRAVSGSMADSLRGPHVVVACRACGFPVACDAGQLPADGFVACANCTYALNPWEAGDLVAGPRVLIDRATLLTRDPRRWEVVVIREPERGELAVKRVVGLPGERLEIRGGEVYVDGVVARKNLDEQRSLARVVHDDRFRPAVAVPAVSAWLPDENDGRWRADEHAFVHAPAAGDGPLAWLTYRHRAGQAPIRDTSAYNQAFRGPVADVRDIGLSCRMTLPERGAVRLTAHDGRQAFTARLDAGKRSVRLSRESEPLAEVEASSLVAGRPLIIELALCDRQVLLGIEGRQVLRHPYDDLERPLAPTSRPLAIGAEPESALRVEGFVVWRDTYYLDPRGAAGDWAAPEPLAADEFFLLGDNSPISIDSRHWPGSGGVARKSLVGRLLPQPAPPRR